MLFGTLTLFLIIGLVILFVFLVWAQFTPAPVPQAKAPILLVITGMIANSNRGGIGTGDDALMERLRLSFTKGFVFDEAMLSLLPQQRVADTTGAIFYDGPLLTDVLAKAGAAYELLHIQAVNPPLAMVLPAAVVRGRDWIIALKRNDMRLSLGGEGPLMLMHRTAEGTLPPPQERGQWMLGVFYIEAK